MRPYISGNRSTPDAIAARLHLLAFVVGDPRGAYNDIGVPALARPAVIGLPETPIGPVPVP